MHPEGQTSSVLIIRLVLIRLFLGVLLVAQSPLLLAGKTIFAFTPTTPTTIALPVNGAATVQYRVTNQTHLTRTLVMRPIKGVTQRTTRSGDCPSLFTLTPSQSCFLTLTINGSEMPPGIYGGPVVCKIKGPYDSNPDPFLCAEPAPANVLAITRGPIGPQIILSVSPSSLIFTVTNSSKKTVTVTNTSLYLTALDVHAENVPLSITQASYHCGTVAPGATCELYFTSGAENVAPTTMQIKGTDTASTPVTIQVGGILLGVQPSLVNLELLGGSQTVTVTNYSNLFTATSVSALGLPIGIDQDATDCLTIPPGGHCTLTFSPTGVLVASSIYSISSSPNPAAPENTIPVSITIGVGGVILSVTPQTIDLLVGGSSLTVNVTNNSTVTTAVNVEATNLSPDIHQDATDCLAVLPLATCHLIFTPTTTVVNSMATSIQGMNTDAVSVNMGTGLIPLSISDSPLDLKIGEPAGGSFTITNDSICSSVTSCATALNVIPVTSLPVGVTSGPNLCASIPPQGTCTMTFIPPLLAPTSAGISVTLQGASTTKPVDGIISVSDAINANLSVSPLQLSFYQGCQTPSIITLQNTSATISVLELTIGPLPQNLIDAGVTFTSNCPSILVGTSNPGVHDCTIEVTGGVPPVGPSNLLISANNLSTSSIPVSIQVNTSNLYGFIDGQYYQAYADSICQGYAADLYIYSIDYCANQLQLFRNSGIVHSQRWSTDLTKVKGISVDSTNPPDLCTGATDGSCNSTQIESQLSDSTAAANYCSSLNSNYFLAALNQIESINTICPNALGNTLQFWSSTQSSTDSSNAYYYDPTGNPLYITQLKTTELNMDALCLENTTPSP